MTDYLELIRPDQEDALLEQVRRLERALSRLAGGEAPARAEGERGSRDWTEPAGAEDRPGRRARPGEGARRSGEPAESAGEEALPRRRTGSEGAEDRPRERDEATGDGGEETGERETSALSPDGGRRRVPGPRLWGESPKAPGRGRLGEEREPAGEPLPLGERLARLDRAVRLADGALRGDGTRPGGEGRPALHTPGRGAGAGGTAERTAPGAGLEPGWGRAAAGEGGLPYGRGGPGAWEETRWAEQADRVFRRDSRRYDGGFYLY